MTTTLAPTPPPNALQIAVATIAPELAAMFVSYLETERPTIEARVEAEGISVVDNVAAAILNALPKNGIIAEFLSGEVKTVVTSLAQQAVAKAGGEVDALYSLAEIEITALGKTLSAL